MKKSPSFLVKLIGPEGYSVLGGVNIFSSSKRSLFFHGSMQTKGGTSLEGLIFLFPKLKLENVKSCKNGGKTPILFRGTSFFRGKRDG